MTTRARAMTIRSLLVMLALCAAGSRNQPGQAARNSKRFYGCVPPTAEDFATFQARGSRMDGLHLNALALRRLRDARLDGQLSEHSVLIREQGGRETDVVASPLQASPSGRPVLDPSSGVRRLPLAVDNSLLPSFPPIIDQRSLQSCSAVATTYYQLTHMVGLTLGWEQADKDLARRFSPAFTYNLSNNGQNRGVSLMRSYAMLQTHGALPLADFPYKIPIFSSSSFRRWPASVELWSRALDHKLDSYGTLNPSQNPEGFLFDIKRFLLNGHVLVAATHIDAWNKKRIQAPPDGRPADHVREYIATRVANDGDILHAVTIVGYDDNIWVDLDRDGRVSPSELGAFKIANSWGKEDWNRGFRWLHYTAVAPIRETPVSDWEPAFVLNQVFWMNPACFHRPSAILEIEMSPAHRQQVVLVADIEHESPGTDRRLCPNVALTGQGGPYHVTGSRWSHPDTFPFALDLTPALYGASAQDPRLSLALTHPQGSEALVRSHIFWPDTGAREPVSLQYSHGKFIGPAPTRPTAFPPALADLPRSIDLRPGQPASQNFRLAPRRGVAPPVRVSFALASHPGFSRKNITLTDGPDGRYTLDFHPTADASGSVLLTLHATDGWNESFTPLRIDFDSATHARPQIAIGEIRREQDGRFIVPFTLSDPDTPLGLLTPYLDSSDVSAIYDFVFRGKGAQRELRIALQPGAAIDLQLSVFDGDRTSSTTVRLRD